MNRGRGFLASAGAAIFAISAISVLSAGEGARPRSGPRDWSHRQIVSGSGTGESDDRDASRDWRARRRQIILADAHHRRASFGGSAEDWGHEEHHDVDHGEDPDDGVKPDWERLTGGTGPGLG